MHNIKDKLSAMPKYHFWCIKVHENNKCMIALTQITNTEIFVSTALPQFQVIEPQSFVYKQKKQQKLLKSMLIFGIFHGNLLQNYIVGM